MKTEQKQEPTHVEIKVTSVPVKLRDFIDLVAEIRGIDRSAVIKSILHETMVRDGEEIRKGKDFNPFKKKS